ncbi:uncharacterized protein LAJ45_03158 [Morchella importuna]|uniref:uncharacterized protein n=1 Tax=Morchella importuna TaxID=1174673 RepID=UPI001E8DD915|nr:uncharacterized protein LAJ45_03158 [Morchella importuna]KAH8152931.1 hypothetical protein LAJ45_03158 [Morchella importuna]
MAHQNAHIIMHLAQQIQRLTYKDTFMRNQYYVLARIVCDPSPQNSYSKLVQIMHKIAAYNIRHYASALEAEEVRVLIINMCLEMVPWEKRSLFKTFVEQMEHLHELRVEVIEELIRLKFDMDVELHLGKCDGCEECEELGEE